MIKNITDLLIYNKSLELLPKLYGLLQKLPNSETFLVNQSKRAGVSIASNIAEGFSKRIFYKEFKRYLLIALASTDELQSHLRIIALMRPELAQESGKLIDLYKQLAKQINKTHSMWQFMPENPL